MPAPQYPVLLYWDQADQVFVVEVPDLPGCAAHGATEEDALEQAAGAMAAWIAVAQESGDSIPEPSFRRLLKLSPAA